MKYKYTDEEVYDPGFRYLNLIDKLRNVFLLRNMADKELVRKGRDAAALKITFNKGPDPFEYHIYKEKEKGRGDGFVPTPSIFDKVDHWTEPVVFIPTKEIVTNAKGFRSLYDEYKLSFDETYYDILRHVFKPEKKSMTDLPLSYVLTKLEKVIGGEVEEENELFYLINNEGRLEFALLAEGFSKLGLLWLLINNGSIEPGCTLFWDEPETNLNPKLLREVVDILLELQRNDVQIFVATHNYVLLKEFDLQMEETDEVMFHSLYRDEDTGSIKRKSTENYLEIHPNTIIDTYVDIYERELKKSFIKTEAGTK